MTRFLVVSWELASCAVPPKTQGPGSLLDKSFEVAGTLFRVVDHMVSILDTKQHTVCYDAGEFPVRIEYRTQVLETRIEQSAVQGYFLVPAIKVG